MTGAPSQWLVFTDLDGTLLDHQSYSWEAARPAVEALKQRAIPLIPVTSKTRAELGGLREALGNDHPYIVENGAATFIPANYFEGLEEYELLDGEHLITSGPGRAALQEPIQRARLEKGFRFKSFTELGAQEIAWLTGLGLDDAEDANRRDATEPLLWQDSDDRLREFTAYMDALGVRCVYGGRFLHVMGQFDKADAVARLAGWYARAAPGKTITRVVLGDGPNDLSMLAHADIAVVIKGRHTHNMSFASAGQVIRTDGYGPASWNTAILDILRTTDRSQAAP